VATGFVAVPSAHGYKTDQLDLASRGGAHRGLDGRGVSSGSCLKITRGQRFQLPATRTPDRRARREGDPSMETVGLAGQKRVPLAAIDLCCFRTVMVEGHCLGSFRPERCNFISRTPKRTPVLPLLRYSQTIRRKPCRCSVGGRKVSRLFSRSRAKPSIRTMRAAKGRGMVARHPSAML